MPKLWSETVEGHRVAVRDAILDATATLVADRGPSSVTMSEVAATAGIGRATLYKYFPDVDSMLHAWHERQIAAHLQQLTELRTHGSDPGEQLEQVLTAFAFMTRQSHDGDGAALHQGQHVTDAHLKLHQLVEGLVADAAKAGRLRSDVPPTELATYCLHALGSASSLPSKAAIRRLVAVVLSGMGAPEPA